MAKAALWYGHLSKELHCATDALRLEKIGSLKPREPAEHANGG